MEVIFELGVEKYLLDWLKMEQIFEKLKRVLVIKNIHPQKLQLKKLKVKRYCKKNFYEFSGY